MVLGWGLPLDNGIVVPLEGGDRPFLDSHGSSLPLVTHVSLLVQLDSNFKLAVNCNFFGGEGGFNDTMYVLVGDANKAFLSKSPSTRSYSSSSLAALFKLFSRSLLIKLRQTVIYSPSKLQKPRQNTRQLMSCQFGQDKRRGEFYWKSRHRQFFFFKLEWCRQYILPLLLCFDCCGVRIY